MAKNELLLFEVVPVEPPVKKDDIPHIIKYMGSKKPILDFIISAIHEIHSAGKPVCDLFAGSCSVSAALRKQYAFISNDIQDYSRILAQTYFSDLGNYSFKKIIDKIEPIATGHVAWFKTHYEDLFYDYEKIIDLEEYQRVESIQRALVEQQMSGTEFHLFTRYYSGTYWSFEQCTWIDALRKASETMRADPIYYSIMASIMYAMSYTTQSTGHFAQYRDGDTEDAMANIRTYRRKSFYDLFKKKLKELIETLDGIPQNLTTTTSSFEECLSTIPEGTTVYADPPYAPVHYSRFYHALETLVKYDYPAIEHKGRYRMDRHQSAFSQKSNAPAAFAQLFAGVIARKAQLILSYSGSGVVSIDLIKELAEEKFKGDQYQVEVRTLDHKHSTMGRFEDHERDVVEYLIIARFKQNPVAPAT